MHNLKHWFRENVKWRFGKRPTVHLRGIDLSTEKGHHIEVINTHLVYNTGEKIWSPTIFNDSKET